MKIYNTYIIAVASLLLLTTVVLAAIGIASLDIYYVLFAVEALVVTELYVHFSPRARRGLNTVGLVVFFGFLIIASTEVVKIVT